MAEPYGWHEGGSDQDWVRSYEALRDELVRLGKSGCLFTRRYYSNFTLNIAVLSEDKQSVTQVLLGAAVVRRRTGGPAAEPAVEAAAEGQPAAKRQCRA